MQLLLKKSLLGGFFWHPSKASIFSSFYFLSFVWKNVLKCLVYYFFLAEKNSKQMDLQETAVIIEMDIEELRSLHKFDQYINLCEYYHLNRCKKWSRLYCEFLLNLQCLRWKSDWWWWSRTFTKLLLTILWNFLSLQSFLRSLTAVEKEKIKLEKRFVNVLKIWNSTKIALPEEEKIDLIFYFYSN